MTAFSIIIQTSKGCWTRFNAMGVVISKASSYCIPTAEAVPVLAYGSKPVLVATACSGGVSVSASPYKASWYIAACANGETEENPTTTSLRVAVPFAAALDARQFGLGVYVAMGSDPATPLSTTLKVIFHTNNFQHTAWWKVNADMDAACKGCGWSVQTGEGVFGVVSSLKVSRVANAPTVLYVCGIVTILDVIPVYPDAVLEVKCDSAILQAIKVGLDADTPPGPAPPSAPIQAVSNPVECGVVRVVWQAAVMPMVDQTHWVVMAIGPASLSSSAPAPVTVPVTQLWAELPVCGKVTPQFVVYGLRTTDGTRTPYSNPTWQCCGPPCCGPFRARTYNKDSDPWRTRHQQLPT
jgi:hypothetical protein